MKEAACCLGKANGTGCTCPYDGTIPIHYAIMFADLYDWPSGPADRDEFVKEAAAIIKQAIAEAIQRQAATPAAGKI